MKFPATFNDLIVEANHFELYKKLIKQLNKDFVFANIDLDLDESIEPEQLKQYLHDIIYRLIQEKFSDYLNVLYIIDVSEKKIKQLDGSDPIKLAEDVAFLILLREWQKVWFKNQYS